MPKGEVKRTLTTLDLPYCCALGPVAQVAPTSYVYGNSVDVLEYTEARLLRRWGGERGGL